MKNITSINKNLIYKDDADIAQITSPILREIIKDSFNELEFLNSTPNFKPLTLEDRDRLLTELREFKSEITKLQENNSDTQILNLVKNQFQIFKDRNLITDQKWNEYKNRWKELENYDSNVSVEDMRVVSGYWKDNNKESKEIIKQSKPLGEMGETTLNEIVNKGVDYIGPVSQMITEHSTEFTGAVSLISIVFMYRGVVKLFDRVAFREGSNNLSGQNLIEYRRMRAKEIKTFMIFGAPLIVGALFTVKNLVFTPKLNVDVKIDSVVQSPNNPAGAVEGNKEIIKDVVLSSSLIPFFNNKKLPSWLKPVILFIISFICLNFMSRKTGLNGDIIESILLYRGLVKLFFILGSISSFILIAYYAITIYLFILFSKNKISVPIYYPQFILDWLKSIQHMSKYENKGLYIEFYFRLILVYLFILLLTLFILSQLFS